MEPQIRYVSTYKYIYVYSINTASANPTNKQTPLATLLTLPLFQAWCIVEHGMGSPEVALTLGSWMSSEAGSKALMRHLVADHQHLDLKEDAKVERAGQGRIKGQRGRSLMVCSV